MAVHIHWLLMLALSLMICQFIWFSFLPAEAAYLFKTLQHSTEIKAFHYVLIFPPQFPKVASLYNYKTTKGNFFKPFRETRSSFCVKITFTSQNLGVDLASSCWPDCSGFQQFLIYNICANYHIANLTLLATGLAWLVTIHRPLEIAIGSQLESSASQQHYISHNTKHDIWA